MVTPAQPEMGHAEAAIAFLQPVLSRQAALLTLPLTERECVQKVLLSTAYANLETERPAAVIERSALMTMRRALQVRVNPARPALLTPLGGVPA
jgi:hypothetical protein